MKRRQLLLAATITMALVASAPGLEAATTAVAALQPVGGASGWGRIEIHDPDHRQTMTVEGWVFGLEPLSTYTLSVNGTTVFELRTDARGDAYIEEISVLRQSSTKSVSLGDPVAAPSLPSARLLDGATILDESMAFTLEGGFALTEDGGGSDQTVHEERISLTDAIGGNATGMAKVERNADGKQEFKTRATGLTSGDSYRVVVDGFLAAVVTGDSVGQASVELEDPDDDNPLPPEMQPIEDLRVVEWIDGTDAIILAGAFTGVNQGGDDDEVEARGEVSSVFDDGFAVETPGGSITVFVDADTMWLGGLTGLADLMPGHFVEVEGTLNDDGSINARKVKLEDDDEQEIEVRGTVDSVADDSFTMTAGDRSVTVFVDADTMWLGGLTGLADLMPGHFVEVEGTLNDDGSINARKVKLEDDDEQEIEVRGTVDSVADDSFTMTAGDRSVTVFVDADTEWRDPLTGIADLTPGDLVEVEGTLNDDGSIQANDVKLED